jgi:opacity protein-like surface antigen
MTKLPQRYFLLGLCALWASPAAAESASAAELAVTDASNSESTAEATESSAYRVAGLAASSSAVAESSGSTGSGWEFAVTPYLWASGSKVDIETPQGEEIKVDESFIDILGDLKFAMMGSFEAKNGRFVIVNDLMFLSMGSSADGHIGPIPIDADADMRLLTTTHLLGYRVVDQGPLFVDVFAGARITSVKVDLDLDIGPLTVERDRKKTEIGPVIGSRFRAPLGGRWGVAVYGDLGGFGVGADLSWQLLGTVQYELSDRWRLAAGWRHFSAKQSKGDWDVHLKLDGPILGVTYRF